MAASIFRGIGAAFFIVIAVKMNYRRNWEDVKCQLLPQAMLNLRGPASP